MAEKSKSKGIPAKTPQENERRLINLAMQLAEKKLAEGSASSQLICHFLKLATTKEELELEKLRSDIRVADAKEKQLQSYEDIKSLLTGAMDAMKSYSSLGGDDHY